MRILNIAEPVEPQRPLAVILEQEANGTWTVRAQGTRVVMAQRLDYFEARALVREKGWQA